MKLEVPVSVRWGDLDAYGHVNNAALLVLLEEVRVSVFWHGRHLPDGVAHVRDPHQDATFVAHQEIEYLAPLDYPSEPIPVTMWISRIGGASAEVCYEVPTLDGRVAARARTTIVMVTKDTGRPRRITPEERALGSQFVGGPIVFRRAR